MTTEKFDYLVIGSGLAGLSYALCAAEHGTVCVLTKGEVTDSNTSVAQGGIAAAVGEADSWQLHEEDTLIAGAGLCDREAVRFLVQRAPAAIRWLMSIGTEFDVEDGEFVLGREGGHSRNRIVHKGDRTGWEIERAMVEAIRRNPGISVYQHAFVTRLLSAKERCVGADAHIDGLGVRRFFARAVMLASGGCGRMYQHTTNPPVATADGIALAAALGAGIENMEFMQFHPTTLYHPQMRSFLISEAVRGAGGILRNHLGRRFMYDYDDRLELAPRDIVARAIVAEIKKLSTWCVYLDTTHLEGEKLKREFPMIYDKLLEAGVEMEKDWIPVVPAQHYSCGGVRTDLSGQSSVSGLFAAGEVACTGVHGANRLASNSLLEALVFSQEAAAASKECPKPSTRDLCEPEIRCIAEAESIRIRRGLQHAMMDNVGIVRNFAGLRAAEGVILELKEEFTSLPEAHYSQHPLETWNLLVAAEHVVRGALNRNENVGLHYNEDLPTAPAPSSSAR